MSDHDHQANKEEIFSKVLRAGRRTYFFDVRSTRADDFYLTITESKKHTNQDGEVYYKKHKIYLYKEDFDNFKDLLEQTTDYIIEQRGSEVISEKHQPDFHKKHSEPVNLEEEDQKPEQSQGPEVPSAYTDVRFDDI